MRLEDVKVGCTLSGVKPGQTVTVLALQWHGGDCVEITYKDESGRPDNRLCYRAPSAGGVPDNIVRTVSENCRTLKFKSFGFESE